MNATVPIPFMAEGPQPLLREIKAPMPFPVAALGPLQKPAEAARGATLAPIEIPAASALTVAALAVQAFADVETLGGKRPASLYAMTIAQSGERKSSCDSLLMDGLRTYEKDQAEAHSIAMGLWRKAHTIWQVGYDRIKASIKSGKGRIEDLDEFELEPGARALPDRTASDPTIQGSARKFAEGQPSLGIFSDEAGQFLGGYAMKSENKQHTLAALNDAWQGNPIRRTLGGKGSSVLYGRRLSAHLMIQPIVARIFMSDRLAGDTGSLPRFLICEPASTIGTRFHRDMRPDAAAPPLRAAQEPPDVPKPWSRVAQVARVAHSRAHSDGGVGDRMASPPRRVMNSGVPQVYLPAWTDLQTEAPEGANLETWARAMQDGRCFLGLWGSQAAEWDWPAVELFEWRPDRVCGLIWELKGREILELTRDVALFSAPGTAEMACFCRAAPSAWRASMGSDRPVNKS